MDRPLSQRTIAIRGAGEMATGVACRLYRANFRRILMLETAAPLAVRRLVSFCEAVYDKNAAVEGIQAVRVDRDAEVELAWAAGKIAVRVDPGAESLARFRPDALVDAVIAKRNVGTAITDAPLVVALGPGFVAGSDCDVVVETNRGHDLGRLIWEGCAEPDTGIPGMVAGYGRERVLRAPVSGIFAPVHGIGARVARGELIGRVGEAEVRAEIGGVLRGLIRPGAPVTRGLKIGDVDPRGAEACCATVSDKARALGGAVLEALLGSFNRPRLEPATHCCEQVLWSPPLRRGGRGM